MCLVGEELAATVLAVVLAVDVALKLINHWSRFSRARSTVLKCLLSEFFSVTGFVITVNLLCLPEVCLLVLMSDRNSRLRLIDGLGAAQDLGALNLYVEATSRLSIGKRGFGF